MWLWEVLRDEAIYTVAEKPWSPFFEVVAHKPSSVNIILRFAPIFLPLTPRVVRDNTRKPLENVLLHYLGLLDRVCGRDLRSLATEKLDTELRRGLWGEEVMRNYILLGEVDRQTLLNLLYEHQKNGANRLDRALKTWFPRCHVYRKEGEDELVLSIPQPETDDHWRKMNLILELFLPIKLTARIYWQKTPCVLDCQAASLDTCRLG